MLPKEHVRGIATAISSAAILSTTGPLIRVLTGAYEMPTMVLACWRNGLLSLTLLLILELYYPRLVEVNGKQLRFLAGYGLLLAVFNLLWTTAVALTGAAMATVLVYTAPAFTVLFGAVWCKDRVELTHGAAVLLALVGVVLITGVSTGVVVCNGPGLACGIGSGLCFALYGLAGRAAMRRGIHPWTQICYTFLVAGLLHLAANGLLSRFSTGSLLVGDLFCLADQGGGWLLLALLAVGPTLVGFGLYNVSLGLLPPIAVSLIAATEPVWTAGLAWLFLGERFSGHEVAGGLLILAAVLLIQVPGKRLQCEVRRLGIMAAPRLGRRRQPWS